MKIQGASRGSGLPAKTIRYYEMIGLVVADRQRNGYRQFADSHVRRLRLVKRARSLGFSVDDCRELLSLCNGHGRGRSEMKRRAQECLAKIDQKIEDLESMRIVLAKLVQFQHEVGRCDCSLLNDLSSEATEQHQ